MTNIQRQIKIILGAAYLLEENATDVVTKSNVKAVKHCAEKLYEIFCKEYTDDKSA